MNANIDCTEALEMGHRLSEGALLTASESARLEAHLAACEDCRVEHAMLCAMAADGTADPAPYLDDLGRRRAMDDILRRVADEKRTMGEAGARQRWWKPFRVALAAGIAAVLLLSAFAVLRNGESALRDEPAQDASVSLARMTLVEGEVFARGRKAASGDGLRSNDALRTSEGRAAMSVAAGISLLAGPETDLSIAKTKTAIRVRLDDGELFASVTPGRKGLPLNVATRAGLVEVKGTVFSVIARGDEVVIRVLRGVVGLTDSGGRTSSLGHSRQMVLGGQDARPLAALDETRMREQLDLTALLCAEDDATMTVSSIPQGAEVAIGDRMVGATPLSVALRAGHHDLVVKSEGGESVSELIAIARGDRLSRVFALAPPRSRLDEPTSQEAEAALGAVGSKNARPAVSAPSELLVRAREARQVRDWQGAAQAYAELQRLHPRSDQAVASLVSLGEIQLEKLGDAGSALSQFDAYVARGKGPLLQEALYNRARALRALDRVSQEEAALADFVERFPSAMQARPARERLAEIRGRKTETSSD